MDAKKVDLSDSFERIPVQIFHDEEEGSRYAANLIATLIKDKERKGEKAVLGLATGSSPISLYRELVRMHREEGLSFRNVITFNLDEYYPIEKDAIRSFHRYMQEHFIGEVDIDPNNCHIPDGMLSKDALKTFCLTYEQKIQSCGGIDLQLLGIGVNGHIGFNEPGSSVFTKTRLVTLTNSTRIANTKDFGNISSVPRLAITMGIETILKARKIILLAWGASKAAALKEAVEGDDREQVPASLLQNHKDVLFVTDQEAAAHLTRFQSPWLTGECIWNDALIKKAVVNMALQLGKPLLNLTNYDYLEAGLGDLLTEKGDAYEINLQVFYRLRDSITGWPGGKPNVVIPAHPERSTPYPKRVLIFSPHPDDDIISMGGTLQRLHDQQHEVHVAYQTSGNIAVTDEFVTRFLDFTIGFEEMTGTDTQRSIAIRNRITDYLNQKKSNQIDSPEIRSIKGLIRKSEAIATCRSIGLTEGHWHFMNLPFYETGTIEKKPISAADIQQTRELLESIQPHQIFCAGDFADPHGTHLMCFHVVSKALEQLKIDGAEWLKDCRAWLYKGAWQEWDLEEIDMAVPMSPDQVIKKRNGIFIHQSQKDFIPFQGSDSREFWQRAEERNAHTSNLFGKLGLTQYAAMEAFKRWHF